MKRIGILSGMLLGACILAEVMSYDVSAQDWSQTIRTSKGSYMEAYAVIATSTSGTSLWGPDSKRGDAICFNNTPNTVWIGTTSVAAVRETHQNILNGFPITSSTTFSLDGGMSGDMFATCYENTTLNASPTYFDTCEIRCMEGKVR